MLVHKLLVKRSFSFIYFNLWLYAFLINSMEPFEQIEQKEFFKAATLGNVQELENLLRHSITINLRRSSIQTALIYAIEANQVDTIKFLLNKGADSSFQDENGNTPIINAIRARAFAAAQELIKVTSQDNLADALAIALVQDNFEITPLVSLLILSGASTKKIVNLAVIEKINSFKRETFDIIENNNIEALADRLKNITTLAILNDKGESVIHCAIRKQNQALLSFLLEHGAKMPQALISPKKSF